MKSFSILAFLAASATVLALPHGDKRAVPDDAETQSLRQAIGLLSNYEYGNQPPTHPPVKPKKAVKPYPALQSKEKRVVDEKQSLRAAIELLNKYEYGTGRPPYYPGPFIPDQLQDYKTVKRSPLKVAEEYELRQAIEVLSSYEYGNNPGHQPPYLPLPNGGGRYNIPRSALKKEEQDEIRQAIEVLSLYEYNGYPPKPLPPHKPNYNIPRSVPEPDKEPFRAAIELLSKYEYGVPPTYPGPIKPYPVTTLKPYPVTTVKPLPTHKPSPIYEPASYKPITKREPLENPQDYHYGGEGSIRAAIELLTKYEYGAPPPYIPIKPVPIPTYKPVSIPTYKPEPVPTTHKPIPVPTYKPQPGKPQCVKRSEETNDIGKSDYNDSGKEDALRAAIELLTKYEYQPGPIKPIPFPTKKPYPQPVPTYEAKPYTPAVLGKRQPIEDKVDAGEEAELRAAIEVLSKVEYGGNPQDGKKKIVPVVHPDPVITPASNI